MKTMRTAGLALIAALATGAAGTVARGSVIMDSFETSVAGDYPLTVVSNSTVAVGNTEHLLTGVAGQWRGVLLNNVTGEVPGFDSVTATVFDGSGFSFLNYSSDSGASGTMTLQYGTQATGPALGLGFNAATDSLTLVLLSYDHAGGQDMHVGGTLQSGATTYTLPTVAVTMAGAQTITIPLPAGANTLDGVSLNFTAPAGTDFRVDSVTLTNVPEPASLGLLGVGVMALIGRKRRR